MLAFSGASVNISNKDSGVVYLAEGPETALSIYEAIPNADIKITLSKSNFKNVDLRDTVRPIVICLDNDSVKIGEGSIICAGVILTTNIEIGNHAHLNIHTTIGHDTKIGNFFTSAPGAKISGNCEIEDRVYIGTNASVREKIKICSDVTIGLGAGVVKHIIEPGTYVGCPATRIK